LLTLAQQNRADERTQRKLAWVLAATGGLFIMNFALFLTEFGERRMMHSPKFYEVVSLAFPFALTAMARAIKLRWAATAAAAFFTAITLVLMWTLQLFPATPKLGPIYQHVTHMVTLSVPAPRRRSGVLHRSRHPSTRRSASDASAGARDGSRLRRRVRCCAVAFCEFPHVQPSRDRSGIQRGEFRLLDESHVRRADPPL
jgi:hypothetical protein